MKHKNKGDNGGLSKALTHRGCTGAAARHRGEDGGHLVPAWDNDEFTGFKQQEDTAVL